MHKKQKKLIGIVISISLMFFGVFFIFRESSPPIYKNQEAPFVNLVNKNSKIIKAILEINGDRYESEINIRMSVYDFMRNLRSEGRIDFKEKNYIGIGKFIEEINGIKREEGKYWIYYVNGKEAQVGVSDYEISPGDVVSWKYEELHY